MLPGSIIAGVLLLSLALFFAVNLQNVMKGSKERSGEEAYAEVERPSGVPISPAAQGTFAFFAEAFLMIYLGFAGQIYLFMPALQFQPPFAPTLQALGLAIVSSGVIVFVWIVVARGRYSVAWEMPEDQKLVTWGPYRYVRHPSYLGYMLMFSGLFLVWLNLIALVPMVGIPSYMALAKPEEELLFSRFGQRYREYMRSTGRFIPRIGRGKTGRLNSYSLLFSSIRVATGTEWRYIVNGDRKRLWYHLDFALGWVMILRMSLCLRA